MVVLPLTLLISGCSDYPQREWWNQLEADSPCYRVNVLDGLDEAQTTEVHDLFACLDMHGHLEPLRPLDRAMELPTRGRLVGGEVAELVNGLPAIDVDPFALGGLALDLIQRDDAPVDDFMDVMLELGWGQSAATLRAGANLRDPALMQSGVLVPLRPLIPDLARTLHDDSNGTLAWVGDVLADPETKRWIRTFDGWVTTEDPRVRPIVDALLRDTAAGILAARSPQNDTWSGSTGDSIRDLVDALLLTGAADAIAPEAQAILDDPIVRADLEAALVRLHQQGDLQLLLPELKWLSTVSTDGTPLQPGEISALAAFLRLLSNANEPMTCSIDLWITNVNLSLGNLGVTVLEYMADMNPDTVQTSTGLLADILGFGITEFIVVEVADSGICDPLDVQMIDDLRAVEAMQGPEAREVLVVLVEVLRVMKYGQQNRIPAMVDMADELHTLGLVDPTQEVVKDLANEPIAQRFVGLVPVLASPESFGIVALPDEPVDLVDALELSVWIFAQEPTLGQTGWQRVEPLARPLLEADATWVALGNGARVMADPNSRLSRAIDLAPPLLDVDPELSVLDDLAPLLNEPRLSDPLLSMAEMPQLVDLVLADTPEPGQERVPLAFAGELVVDGTLDDLLKTIDIVLAAF
ncbi:MAG: hypothetical protein H6737_27430 [Alphaproteobacteria bacterium]|nr:hypothetical protein [Alphaproteobacteria bacterium]